MQNRKLLLLPLLFLLCSTLFFSCSRKEILNESEINWLAKHDSINIALFPYYPPYQFINDEDEIVGVFMEYIGLIEERTNYKFKRKYYRHWPELMDDVRNGKIDVVMQIQSTKDRSSYLNFYAELFESNHVIATRKDSFYGDDISDFRNKKISVPEDYAIFENLKRKYPRLTFIEDKNDLTCLQKLNSGEYDAYIGPKAVVNYLIKTENLDNLKITSEIGLTYKPGISVDKKNEILNEIIIKSINSISESENQSIIENWLYKESKPFYKKIDFIAPLIIIILSGLIIFLAINFYLGLIVNRKTKELRIAKDIAEKDDQLKTAFIDNVSHEIKTPMNAIVDFSKFLNTPKLTIKEKNKNIKVIINSSKQLIDSIDNILEISKLQTKQVRLNNEVTDLYEILDTICSIFEIEAKKKGISLILNNNLEEDKRFAFIDSSKLIKIINGLVENAIKYTEKGAVLISCMVQNSSLIIMIRDSGIGIHTKDRKNILIKKPLSEKNEGLGLGLTIAKKNTDLMKGTLSFSSIPNQGSTFRLELPYEPIGQKEPSTISHKNTKARQYSALIAEDGEVNFLFLKTILMKIEGYDFIINRAKNGKEAVTFCKENQQIDIIFMDIKMPEMNGYDATKAIKKMNPALPIIAQTAYSTNEDVKSALGAGCDDFISKPIHPKSLEIIIKKYFEVSTNEN